jgi:hypothetical protein
MAKPLQPVQDGARIMRSKSHIKRFVPRVRCETSAVRIVAAG